MKTNKISEQIDPFKNKDSMGLFTFYLQSQLPHQVQNKNQSNEDKTKTIDKQSNPSLEFKRITARKSVHQNKKTIKMLTQQNNQANSVSLLFNKNKYERILTWGSAQQIEKIKELINQKRNCNKKMIKECVRNNKKMQSLKSIRLQRKINNFRRSQNYSATPIVASHSIYPLEQAKYKQYLSNKSPKKRQSPQKDYHEHRKSLLPEIQKQPKSNQQNTIHQLRCQVMIYPQKFRSIICPSAKKYRNSYVKNNHLLINNQPLRQEPISIEMKPKYETPSELEKLINRRENALNLNKKISKVTDYQDTPYGLARFNPTKKHHIFNTLERSLMSSLQKVDEDEFQNDLKQLFKDNSSHLLKKRSEKISQPSHVYQFRAKNSLFPLQKPQRLSDIIKNESKMIILQESRLKRATILNKSIQKNEYKDMSQKDMKHNLQEFATKIKDRYQSI